MASTVISLLHGALAAREDQASEDDQRLFTYCMHNNGADSRCDPAIVPNFYGYRISLAPNAAFLACFALSLVAFLGTYAWVRRGLGFTIAMSLGLICEILGYAGRVISWKNQWNETGFLIQICCLTIAPAFLAAAIYLCLRRIVYAFGRENSRIPPEYYTRIFIPCDVVSLILQAAGGAMASIASHNGNSVKTGDNIMIAGLAFQVFTMLMFIIASLDFAWRTFRARRRLGAEALSQDPRVRAVRGSALFKLSLGALALATICIFWRCVYRVAELSNGWDGPLMKNQDLFVGFEGVMIVVACLILNIFNPVVGFRELMSGAGGWSKSKMAAHGEGGKSEPVSESEMASY